MPTELWNLDEWPSPAPEAVVRSRVRGRARSILRLRVAVAAVAASLAVVVGLTDLPAPGSGVKMRTETPWLPADQPNKDEDEAEQTAPPAEQPAPVVHAVGAAAELVEPPPLAPAAVVDSPPVPSVRRPHGPTFVDLVGDAQYETGCRGAPCPGETDLERESPSQAMYDLASVEAPCSGPTVEFRLNLADLDAAPTPNRAGMTPSYASYHLGFIFRDQRQTMLTLGIQRDLISGDLWAGGVVSFYVGEENYHTFLSPSLRRDGDAWVVTVPDFPAAFSAAYPGAQPPDQGAPVDASAISTAVYRNADTFISQGVDEITFGEPGSAGRWCD